MEEATEAPLILLHAPTRSALRRARSNAANIRKEAPQAQVCIVANGEAVAEVIEQPDAAADSLTWLCPNSLKRLALTAPDPARVLIQAAVLAIARMQQDGWVYIRA